MLAIFDDKMDVLSSFVVSLHSGHIVVATILEFIFSFFWFYGVVHHFDTYYLAADKGVRRAQHALHRYPVIVVHATNLMCCALRALSVAFVAYLIQAKTLLDFQVAAVLVTLGSFLTIHRHFAYHRPIQLFVTMWGFELATSMIVAVFFFFLKSFW